MNIASPYRSQEFAHSFRAKHNMELGRITNDHVVHSNPGVDDEMKSNILTIPKEILTTILYLVFYNNEQIRNGWSRSNARDRRSVMATCRSLHHFVQSAPVLWRFLPIGATSKSINTILSHNRCGPLDVNIEDGMSDEACRLLTKEGSRWESLNLYEVDEKLWNRVIASFLVRTFAGDGSLPDIKRLRISNSNLHFEVDAVDVLLWFPNHLIDFLSITSGRIPSDYTKLSLLRHLHIKNAYATREGPINSLFRLLQNTPSLETLFYCESEGSHTNISEVYNIKRPTLPRLRTLNLEVVYDGRQTGVFTVLSKALENLVVPSLEKLTICQNICVDTFGDDEFTKASRELIHVFGSVIRADNVTTLSLSFKYSDELRLSRDHFKHIDQLGILFARNILSRFTKAIRVVIHMLDIVAITDILSRQPNINTIKIWTAEKMSSSEMDAVLEWLESHQDEHRTLFIETHVIIEQKRLQRLNRIRGESKERWAGSTWVSWHAFE